MTTPSRRLCTATEVMAPAKPTAEISLQQQILPTTPSRRYPPSRDARACEPAAGEPSRSIARIARERCKIKGCVFPAAPHAEGTCVYHYRQQYEPVLFHSQQPTLLLLERAKFELPACEHNDYRGADRRRLAALREAFLLEELA